LAYYGLDFADFSAVEQGTWNNIDVFVLRLILVDFSQNYSELERGPMPNVMAALPNIGGALCSTPQSLADAHYQSAMQ